MVYLLGWDPWIQNQFPESVLPEVWIPDLLNKIDSNREWKLRPISLLKIGKVMNCSTKKFQAQNPVIFLSASSLPLIINVTLAS